MKIVIATELGALWALERVWHTDETNLRCTGNFRICMPNPSTAAFISQRPYGQMDMAKSTRLVILIKNIYFL